MSRALLVVDDDPAVADDLRIALQPRDIRVDVASDAEGALRLLDEKRHCALLLNVGLAGAEVLRHMSDGGLRIPIVAIANGVPPDVRMLPAAEEIRLVIQKPLEQSLLAAVALGVCGIAP